MWATRYRAATCPARHPPVEAPAAQRAAASAVRGAAAASRSSLVRAMAGHQHTSSDVSDAFSKRMSQVREEFEQMQRVQNVLKGNEQKMRKNIEPLQKELEQISKQVSAAYAKRDKLRQQLASCEEEIKELEVKKTEACDRIYTATATVEQKRAELLNNASHMGARLGSEE
ncbi:unnamed protein product [Prorocentrum cordatum]|uniref:RAB6-interacting golgin n=1 Tax=Prorocentrum cordatum TaxID=2364126 RepID=A0ABN9PF04_9DINO|nr:unnamed protein product [Polarella glacialis]